MFLFASSVPDALIGAFAIVEAVSEDGIADVIQEFPSAPAMKMR